MNCLTIALCVILTLTTLSQSSEAKYGGRRGAVGRNRRRNTHQLRKLMMTSEYDGEDDGDDDDDDGSGSSGDDDDSSGTTTTGDDDDSGSSSGDDGNDSGTGGDDDDGGTDPYPAPTEPPITSSYGPPPTPYPSAYVPPPTPPPVKVTVAPVYVAPPPTPPPVKATPAPVYAAQTPSPTTYYVAPVDPPVDAAAGDDDDDDDSGKGGDDDDGGSAGDDDDSGTGGDDDDSGSAGDDDDDSGNGDDDDNSSSSGDDDDSGIDGDDDDSSMAGSSGDDDDDGGVSADGDDDDVPAPVSTPTTTSVYEPTSYPVAEPKVTAAPVYVAPPSTPPPVKATPAPVYAAQTPSPTYYVAPVAPPVDATVGDDDDDDSGKGGDDDDGGSAGDDDDDDSGKGGDDDDGGSAGDDDDSGTGGDDDDSGSVGDDDDDSGNGDDDDDDNSSSAGDDDDSGIDGDDDDNEHGDDDDGGDAGDDDDDDVVGSPSSYVFIMTNAASGNEVLVFSRDETTGKLTYEAAVSTDGIGALLDGTSQDDPLASQDSLIVAGKCLVGVNAGSNTVTSFIIQSDPILKLVSTTESLGTYPVSIAEHDGLVYVMNAGGSGSISGFKISPHNCVLETVPGSTVSLGQNDALVSDPPFFAASPAQVGFTPAGDELIVIIKGTDGGLAGTGTGTISHFAVESDGIVWLEKRITPTGVVPFSFDFDTAGNLLVVEAFGLNAPLSANAGTVTSYTILPEPLNFLERVETNQTTTCWIKYIDSVGCAFTTNNGGNSISSVKTADSGLALKEGVVASLNAPIDIDYSSDERYFYALSTGHTDPNGLGQPAIYVYDIGHDCGLTEIQVMSEGIPDENTSVNGVVGIAVFP